MQQDGLPASGASVFEQQEIRNLTLQKRAMRVENMYKAANEKSVGAWGQETNRYHRFLLCLIGIAVVVLVSCYLRTLFTFADVIKEMNKACQPTQGKVGGVGGTIPGGGRCGTSAALAFMWPPYLALKYGVDRWSFPNAAVYAYSTATTRPCMVTQSTVALPDGTVIDRGMYNLSVMWQTCANKCTRDGESAYDLLCAGLANIPMCNKPCSVTGIESKESQGISLVEGAATTGLMAAGMASGGVAVVGAAVVGGLLSMFGGTSAADAKRKQCEAKNKTAGSCTVQGKPTSITNEEDCDSAHGVFSPGNCYYPQGALMCNGKHNTAAPSGACTQSPASWPST